MRRNQIKGSKVLPEKRVPKVGDMQKGAEECHFGEYVVSLELIEVWMEVENFNGRRNRDINVLVTQG